MKRTLERLTGAPFDVLIIGGGIYGATLAWEASSRGLTTALIERDDFGGATSANSLKTIHGGLRYLQNLDLKRFRESVRERKILLRIAPHLVHLLPVVLPTYGHLGKGPALFWAGLLVNDLLSIDRNRGVEKSKRIPCGRILSRDLCLRLVPGIDPQGVTGAAFWTDAQMYSSERLTLAFIHSAVDAGATVANYVEAERFLAQNGRLIGVKAKDRLTGGQLEIRARCILNACGGWVDDLLSKAGKKGFRPLVRLSTAMNLVIHRELLPETAAGIYSRFQYIRRDGSRYRGVRTLFLSPWRGMTLAGTFHRPYDGAPDALTLTEEEIDQALEEINGAYPGAAVKRKEVTFAHKGFLPMEGVNPKTGEVRLTPHYRIRDHRHEGMEGLISVSGVKYTTARDVAEKTIHWVCRKLGKRRSSITRQRPLHGGEIPAFPAYLSHFLGEDPVELPARILRHLVYLYGTDHVSILRLIAQEPRWQKTIPGSEEVIEAEILHAVREEMAQKLGDVVLRRTDLGTAGYPGDEALTRCARLMAGELGWSESRIQQEIEEVKSLYRFFR